MIEKTARIKFEISATNYAEFKGALCEYSFIPVLSENINLMSEKLIKHYGYRLALEITLTHHYLSFTNDILNLTNKVFNNIVYQTNPVIKFYPDLDNEPDTFYNVYLDSEFTIMSTTVINIGQTITLSFIGADLLDSNFKNNIVKHLAEPPE